MTPVAVPDGVIDQAGRNIIRASRSEFLTVRGLKYHIRRWGSGDAPLLYILHGLLDVSETFQLLVDALARDWNVIAPDWRGCGLTEWPQDGYWFPDYLGDLEQVVNHYSGNQPALFVGHSMGGQAASLYAGIRPERVKRLVLLDSLNVPERPIETLPKRFRRWLDEIAEPPQNKTYETFEQLAVRVRHHNPKLTEARAAFVARCWGRETSPGHIELLGDPKHRMNMPGLYKSAESMVVWREITAPVLFIDGGDSWMGKLLGTEEIGRRRSVFRDHQTHDLPGIGHMIHHEAPEQAAVLIEHFLTQS
jgi:pimeloyl-ACP methyl ester carboxylesterase